MGIEAKWKNRGIRVGKLPCGPLDKISDVPGVTVGHCTLADGEVQTGVTALLPHQGDIFHDKVMAASHVINGFGKTTGLVQIDELGTLETPILFTNTLSVGTVETALVKYMLDKNPDICETTGSVNPVVCECNDSGTDYILKNVEAYDDNQSKQITYDSLILEYVEIDKTLRSSAIRRAYTQQLLDTFQAAGGVGGDEASHAAIESEINKYEQTLVDYYQIVNQTSMEHNRSLSADYLQTTSSTRVWPSINTKLYLAIGFVFFFLVGCALAVVVGRSRDFVEYFMYVDKKTGLPNRDRVDAMMARLEKQGLLPSHFTCMCFQFTSLNHLSREYGYSVGNHVLRDFAGLVAALGTEESFIGSNGAGQIMGFFRECNAVKAEAILEVLDEQIQEYNSLNPDYAIEYKAASATSDDEKEFNIRDLLRCAFKKLRDANKPQPETAHETV